MKRLPTDAFQTFVSLGDSRTYQRVADHFQVSKRTVVRRARSEGWQHRLREIQRQAAVKADSDAVETLATVNRRHLRILKALEAKALATLQSTPMRGAGEAAKALLAALAQERAIHDVPGATGPTVLLVSTGVPAPAEWAAARHESNRQQLLDAGLDADEILDRNPGF